MEASHTGTAITQSVKLAWWCTKIPTTLLTFLIASAQGKPGDN